MEVRIWNWSYADNARPPTAYGGIDGGGKSCSTCLLEKQQQAVGERIFKSSVQPGGWGFSSNNTKHPDTDDTVACLEALYPLRDRYSDQWWKGVNWLLGMQNRDGGWSAFEKNSTKNWLEWLPANDMKRAMTDPSTPDITGRVLDFLARYRIVSTTQIPFEVESQIHYTGGGPTGSYDVTTAMT